MKYSESHCTDCHERRIVDGECLNCAQLSREQDE
jgi:hypothetical protein